MMNGPIIKGNPLKISVSLLLISYLVGEFIIQKYPLAYIFQLIGILGLIFSVGIFISGFSSFKSHDEDPTPTTKTNRLIKKGIYAYTRNPIYLAFVCFHLSMFLVFNNVMYLLSSVVLAIWLHHWVIEVEENYLEQKFDDEFISYKNAVKRWLFF